MYKTHETELVPGPGGTWGWRCKTCTAEEVARFGLERPSAEAGSKFHCQSVTGR
jgi:hypothetical protein